MLPVVVARSSSENNAICYVLQVLWMTSCFILWGQTEQNQRWCYISSTSPDGSTGAKMLSMTALFWRVTGAKFLLNAFLMPLVEIIRWTSSMLHLTRCRPNGTKHYWHAVECYHGAMIRLEAAWRHRLACKGEAASSLIIAPCMLQTTTDDRQQRASLVWLPTLCVGGPVITKSQCKRRDEALQCWT